MSEEELEKVKGIVKRLYAGTGVTFGDIVDTAPWLDKLVNEVEKLQKENEKLKEEQSNKLKQILKTNTLESMSCDGNYKEPLLHLRKEIYDLIGVKNE